MHAYLQAILLIDIMMMMTRLLWKLTRRSMNRFFFDGGGKNLISSHIFIINSNSTIHKKNVHELQEVFDFETKKIWAHLIFFAEQKDNKKKICRERWTEEDQTQDQTRRARIASSKIYSVWWFVRCDGTAGNGNKAKRKYSFRPFHTTEPLPQQIQLVTFTFIKKEHWTVDLTGKRNVHFLFPSKLEKGNNLQKNLFSLSILLFCMHNKNIYWKNVNSPSLFSTKLLNCFCWCADEIQDLLWQFRFLTFVRIIWYCIFYVRR